MRTTVLDEGYVSLVESWGSDERIIEAARMSTQKGFKGWGLKCVQCDAVAVAGKYPEGPCPKAVAGDTTHVMAPGDEKLLKYLWDHKHATPFEMAGLTIEVKAPIFVFREWHRHRVPFGYNEMSARYIPIPDENYVPSVHRVLMSNEATANRQAQGSGRALSEGDAFGWLAQLADVYEHAQKVYANGIKLGVSKEIARLPVPVARYSVMRATGNLRGWLGFLALRCDPAAQWEIRQYANIVADIVSHAFPRVYEVSGIAATRSE